MQQERPGSVPRTKGRFSVGCGFSMPPGQHLPKGDQTERSWTIFTPRCKPHFFANANDTMVSIRRSWERKDDPVARAASSPQIQFLVLSQISWGASCKSLSHSVQWGVMALPYLKEVLWRYMQYRLWDAQILQERGPYKNLHRISNWGRWTWQEGRGMREGREKQKPPSDWGQRQNGSN